MRCPLPPLSPSSTRRAHSSRRVRPRLRAQLAWRGRSGRGSASSGSGRGRGRPDARSRRLLPRSGRAGRCGPRGALTGPRGLRTRAHCPARRACHACRRPIPPRSRPICGAGRGRGVLLPLRSVRGPRRPPSPHCRRPQPPHGRGQRSSGCSGRGRQCCPACGARLCAHCIKGAGRGAGVGICKGGRHVLLRLLGLLLVSRLLV